VSFSFSSMAVEVHGAAVGVLVRPDVDASATGSISAFGDLSRTGLGAWRSGIGAFGSSPEWDTIPCGRRRSLRTWPA
jgi:hypothetical protein